MKTDPKKTMTRRQFIRDTSVAAAGGALLMSSGSNVLAQMIPTAKSDVVLIRDKDVLDGDGAPKANVVLSMLDQAVGKLTGKKAPLEGWKTLIKPTDVVGIKTNVWSPIGTTSQVEEALKSRVMGAGVAEKDIAISDRGVLRDPVFARATALINARPMRTHHWSGVGSLIKNYVMFVSDPYNYHEDACARLGEIWTYPIVKDKTRLNVLVMFTPQFHNVGPHGFSPRHVSKYYGLIVGFDPVAIDTIGAKIIGGMRKKYFGEERPVSPSPTHIAVADTKYGVGNADPAKINLIKMGYDVESFC
ncbi:DUF362 domain-containing protein [Candidatus Eisenbacteria bacterium]|uniref:DUF362 domain-containing protein n=1 Tax=Eiseniibacteriota bacterium TaxID=2212470 RepID=A0ABV6YJ34_UNCEI